MGAYYSRSGSYSRSFNAEVAEIEGRMPLSRAKKIVAAEHGCTQTVAACALELIHDGEWHHVGKFATEVAYHDTTLHALCGAIAEIKRCGGPKKFAARRMSLRAVRSDRAWRNDSLTRNAGRILRMQANPNIQRPVR